MRDVVGDAHEQAGRSEPRERGGDRGERHRASRRDAHPRRQPASLVDIAQRDEDQHPQRRSGLRHGGHEPDLRVGGPEAASHLAEQRLAVVDVGDADAPARREEQRDPPERLRSETLRRSGALRFRGLRHGRRGRAVGHSRAREGLAVSCASIARAPTRATAGAARYRRTVRTRRARGPSVADRHDRQLDLAVRASAAAPCRPRVA